MTAVFLASDEAPFINAAAIIIDGGRSVVYHDDRCAASALALGARRATGANGKRPWLARAGNWRQRILGGDYRARRGAAARGSARRRIRRQPHRLT